MPTRLSFVTLDVFTDSRYAGNPLAIVHVPGGTNLSQNQKQRIAREFNLSETVFLHDLSGEDRAESLARMDIFTSNVEIPFAGHPTIGTANYLLGLTDADRSSTTGVRALQLKAGRFPIALKARGAVRGAQVAVAHDVHTHRWGYDERTHRGGHNKPLFSTHYYPVVSIVKGMTFVLAQLGSLDDLGDKTGSLVHDDEAGGAGWETLDEGWRDGIMATYFFVDLGDEEDEDAEDDDEGDEGDDGAGQGNGGRRFVRFPVRRLRTRMFSSREDAATGSAASALAAHLSLRKGRAGGRYKYHLTQGVEMGRPSQIYVEVTLKAKAGGAPGEIEVDKVLLSGSAVLNVEGTLCVPE